MSIPWYGMTTRTRRVIVLLSAFFLFAFEVWAQGPVPIGPTEVGRAIETATAERPTGSAVGVATAGERSILSVELDDGTEVNVAVGNWMVESTSRPLFARRQRRIGRSLGDLGPDAVGLVEAYTSILEVDGRPGVSSSQFESVEYVISRRRLLIRLIFEDVTVFVNPRTGDMVDA